jgi:class 3 adenylate cyclase/tetratricopeptide (TPR) repeat protein
VLDLVPRFILDQHRQRRGSGTFRATSLFVDLVGFTPMTESLMVHGTAGAEQVSSIVNSVFEPAVRSTYACGGWVAKYAGDAFVALFPDNAKEPRPEEAAGEIAGRLSESNTLETPYGAFTIAARVGVACGRVTWGIIPGRRRSLFFFAGSAIQRSIQAQTRSTPGHYVVDRRYGGPGVHPAPPRILPRAGRAHGAGDRVPHGETGAKLQALVPFVPRSIRDLGTAGEFRDVACVFMGFHGLSGSVDRYMAGRAAEVLSVVAAKVHRFGGYLSELEFGDKGALVVAYFGAPQGLERPMLHALGCAAETRDALRGMTPVRAGVTFGRVYAGLVGSALRAEYKAVGRTVNLAARLMASAPWGVVLLDRGSSASLDESLPLEDRGSVRLKGVEQPVPVLAVTGTRRTRRTKGPESPLVGREREVARLRDILAPLERGSGLGIVYIDGRPGVGKSRLVNAVKTTLCARLAWFSMPCDGVLRESLNPLRRWARAYFGGADDRSRDDNEQAFEVHFSALLAETSGAAHRELARTKSVLGALAGLHWQGSLYEQLDAKGRFANTASAVKCLLRCEAARRPVVVELEDCHWIDLDSAEILRQVLRGLRRDPVAVLAPCRPGDDGSPFRLELGDVATASLQLQMLDVHSSALIAEARLGAPPSRDLAGFLWSKSEGNPFHLEQLLELLTAKDALRQVRGRFRLVAEPRELPSTVSSLVVARLDRLPARLRRAAKVAAVLGREFNVEVLASVLAQRAGSLVDLGVRHGLWTKGSSGRCAFLHAPVRDALYEIQLEAQRRDLHRRAGAALETIHEGMLESQYGALAHHFDVGGDAPRARLYLERAAMSAEQSYASIDALRFLERLRVYVSEQRTQVEISVRRGRLMDRVGRFDEAASLLEATVRSARDLGDEPLLGRALNALGNVRIRLGELDAAEALFEEDLAISRRGEENVGISTTLGNIGRVCRTRGDFPRAIRCYREALRYAARARSASETAYAVGNLGTVLYCLGDLRRAERCFARAGVLCREIGDANGISQAEGSLGLVHFQRGEFEPAAQHFGRQREIAERMGDMVSVAFAIGSMGLVHEHHGSLKDALECYRQKLELAEELGHQSRAGIAMAELARVHVRLAQYGQALELLDKAIAIVRALGVRDYLAHFMIDKAVAVVSQGEKQSSERLGEVEGLCAEAVDIAQGIGLKKIPLVAAVTRSRLRALQGDRSGAVAGLLDLAGSFPETEDQARIYSALARVSKRPDHVRVAIGLYESLSREDPDTVYREEREELAALITSDTPGQSPW